MEKNIEILIKSERGCRQLIANMKYPDNQFSCRSCGNSYGYAMQSRPVIECTACGSQDTLTAGTFFHAMRTPLVKLFSIISEVCSGVQKSCSTFSRESGIPYTTVWRFLQKLRKVMGDSFPVDPSQLVHDLLLSKILFKRSCESESALATEAEDDKESQSDDVNISESCSPDAFEVLDCHPVIECINSISKTHQGISRKYCQPYVAQFNFISRFRGQLEALIYACVRSAPTSNKEIAAYTSPALLTFPIGFASA